MERIQINGTWYVREEDSALNPQDLCYSKTCQYETNDYSWEAVLMTTKDGKRLYQDVGFWISFTNKKEDYKETWDNSSWLLGVYHNQKDSIIEAIDAMNEKGVEEFKEFIGHIIELGWLKDE